MTNSRPYKGNSLLTLLDDYTVIDIETSMNGRLYGEIVEVGAVKVRNNQIIDTFDELIKPTQPIDSWTQSIHHISNAMVKDKPSIEIVYPMFLQFIGQDLLVGHNVNFDINYLYDYHQELNHKPLSNHFVDTLRLARRTLKGQKSYSLSNLSEYFGFTPTIHRAVEDCKATHRLYQILKNRLSFAEKAFLATIQVPKNQQNQLNLEEIESEMTLFNQNSFFNKKAVFFSGKFTTFTKKDAAQVIVNAGGKVFNELHPHVDYLIIGDVNYQMNRFGKISSKHQQALNLQKQGYPIEILTQEDFINKLNQFETD